MSNYIAVSVYYIVLILGVCTLLKYTFKFIVFIFSKLFHTPKVSENNKRRVRPWRVYENRSIKNDKTSDYVQACWDEVK